MNRPAMHPGWCDPARCTTELDPVLGIHRGRPNAIHTGPMAVTAGLFRVAGDLVDPAITTLVEAHLGRLDDLSASTGTAVGLLTLPSAAAVAHILRTLARNGATQ